MILEFGSGRISVCITSSNGKDGVSDILLLEDGLGTGIISEIPKTRKHGTEIDLNGLAGSPSVCLLQFKNLESLQVVISRLEIIKKEMTEKNKTLLIKEL